jgi:hypothetical protein
MLTTNDATACNNTYVSPNATIYTPPPLQSFQQQPSYPTQGDGSGGGCSCGVLTRCKHGGGGRGTPMPPQVLYVGGAGIIPHIPSGVQPSGQQLASRFSNIIKVFTNQNVCFLCGFDVADLHTSATCNCRKAGHQNGFTCSNYMEYARVNHPFCRNGNAQDNVPQQLLMVWGGVYRC